jgi:hypothetical protein
MTTQQRIAFVLTFAVFAVIAVLLILESPPVPPTHSGGPSRGRTTAASSAT